MLINSQQSRTFVSNTTASISQILNMYLIVLVVLALTAFLDAVVNAVEVDAADENF
jgi:hypothetical protein